jgi:hypothetical protein
MKGEFITIETAQIMADIEKENKELQQRIDKAIEYIENNKENTYQTLDFENNKSYNSALLELKSLLEGKDNE